MSTRAAIIARIGNLYHGIYCHNDGYPEGVGAVLQKHYTDPAKVEQLIELGDISSLGPRLNPTGPHSFDHRELGTTVAYHRDRGEKLERPTVSTTIGGVRRAIDHRHFYVFENGAWGHTEVPLTEGRRAKILPMEVLFK